MMNIYRFFWITALFFYILCWLTDQPTKVIWGIGISLPWYSLFVGLPILFIGNVDEKDNWKIWCYTYAVSTLLYIVIVYAIGGQLLQLLPHLLCCASAVAYMVLNKKYGEN